MMGTSLGPFRPGLLPLLADEQRKKEEDKLEALLLEGLDGEATVVDEQFWQTYAQELTPQAGQRAPMATIEEAARDLDEILEYMDENADY